MLYCIESQAKETPVSKAYQIKRMIAMKYFINIWKYFNKMRKEKACGKNKRKKKMFYEKIVQFYEKRIDKMRQIM